MQKQEANWYTSWFCTPYYHMLYRDRDIQEAAFFMDNLLEFIGLPRGSRILDLGCGRGRHSVYLSDTGYEVTGIDLSENNISIAKQFENDRLQFEVHDMRDPIPGTFDAVLNLFTSFGYFEDESDNIRTIRSIKSALAESGLGVIDFMNIRHTEKHLIPYETKLVEGILFHIERRLKDGYVVKNISFTAEGTEHRFTEKVQAIGRSDFKRYFKSAGVRLLHCLGSYDMQPFQEETSERLILIFN